MHAPHAPLGESPPNGASVCAAYHSFRVCFSGGQKDDRKAFRVSADRPLCHDLTLTSMMKPARRRPRLVLLDRDGTINVERHYLADADQVELLPQAGAGLRTMQRLGLRLAVVTNQSGVARGLITPQQVETVHLRLRELLLAEGVELAGIYTCPHGPDEGCRCRKPQPGLAEAAARELGVDLTDCVVIGDKPGDLELAWRIGGSAILVRTGYGGTTAVLHPAAADFIVEDLGAAALVIDQLLASDSLEGE